MFETIVIICAALYLILYIVVAIMAKSPRKRNRPIIHIHKYVVKAPQQRLTPFQKIDLRNRETLKTRFHSRDYRR